MFLKLGNRKKHKHKHESWYNLPPNNIEKFGFTFLTAYILKEIDGSLSKPVLVRYIEYMVEKLTI